MGVLDDLRRAREAFERRDWIRAYRGLSDLDRPDLAVDDLVALAGVAYLTGRRNGCIQALQRAHREATRGGDARAAARTAYWLTLMLWFQGELAVGNGWLERGMHTLDELGEDVVERGYLLERQAFGHIMAGEFDRVAELAPQVTSYGRRFHDPDLQALGLNMQGRLAIFSGQVRQGVGYLDEAMVAVLTDEVTPIHAGIVYCSAIEACQSVADFRRVGEWTHALTTWCNDQPGLVAFTGQCAVHRGQLMSFHGAFRDAVDELERAAHRYARSEGDDPAQGMAHYERGEALRRLGRHPETESAFARASAFGHPCQPGRALLLFQRGERDAAVAAIRRLLAERGSPVERSGVLGAAVLVLCGSGQTDDASPLADELAGLGADFGSDALKAAGAQAQARVALACGDGTAALARGRQATETYAALGARYDVARSRVLAGRSLRLLGDEDSARAEFTAAQAVFRELGTGPAGHEVAELIGRHQIPGGLSDRELEVLRLVASGLSNPAIAVELVLSEKTVARHLSNIFTKLDVRSRTAAAAFAHEHGLT